MSDTPAQDRVTALVLIGARLVYGTCSDGPADGLVRIDEPLDYAGAIATRPSATVRGGTDVNIQRACSPIGGLASLRSIVVRPDSVMPLEILDAKERKEVQEAAARAYALVAEMRREASGIAAPRIHLVGK